MINLVVFLGNPGPEHSQTRHNVAWMLADRAHFLPKSDWQKKFKGSYCQLTFQDEKCYFLKPETFMNLSGECVLALMQFYKLKSENLLVVHDDLELNFGQVGIKKGGGLAGHNGLRSISNVLNTQNFYRFRLGISRPSHGNVSAYVLSKFSSDEQIVLSTYLTKAVEILEICLQEGIQSAEKKYPKIKLI